MFYLHIPKTGGQTLATRLASAYLPQDTYLFHETLRYPQDLERLRELLNGKKFIECHVEGEMLCGKVGLDVLVTVRDPVEQLISNFRHIRREPRSIWHRAASMLSLPDFFDSFGSFFYDHQTRYLLSAFVRIDLLTQHLGYHRAINSHLFETLDRVRWLVPTESIDEFVTLWSLETTRPVPNTAQVLNVGPRDDLDLEVARKALAGRPHLYAFDSLLHQIAKTQFSGYRKKVLDARAPWTFPDNSRRAYFSENCGIWLTENWYDPECKTEGNVWWSGPTERSELRFRRNSAQKFLGFDVTVVNGISHGEIRVFSKSEFRELEVITKRHSREHVSYIVSIQGLDDQAEVVLLVPNCMAPVMTTKDDTSLRRCAFLTTNWRLLDQIPEG